MDPFEQELRDALGAAEPPPGGRHDLAPTAVRTLRRRRVVRGVAAGASTLAVVGAVGLGVAAGLSPAPPRPPASTTQEPVPTSATPTTPASPTSPPPTSPPPTTATADPDPSTPLLVTGDEEAAIYRLPAGATDAVLERPLDPPARPGQLRAPGWGALSAGEDPVACLWWQVLNQDYTGIEESIACYAPGSSEPVVIPLPDGFETRTFALRADGSEIAVVSTAAQTYGTIAVSKLDGLAPVRWRTWPSGVDDDSSTIDVAFAGGADRLLVSVREDQPVARGLRVLDLTTDGTPWSDLDRVAPPEGSGTYELPSSLDDRTALARLDDSLADSTAAVGVVVDLADGQVLRTVAHPDRDVVDLSGTRDVLVYAIRDSDVGLAGDQPLRHFVLRAGQSQAAPLGGLPDEPYLGVEAGPPSS